MNKVKYMYMTILYLHFVNLYFKELCFSISNIERDYRRFTPKSFPPSTDISSLDVSPTSLQKCRRFTPYIENDLTK